MLGNNGAVVRVPECAFGDQPELWASASRSWPKAARMAVSWRPNSLAVKAMAVEKGKVRNALEHNRPWNTREMDPTNLAPGRELA